MFNNIVKLLINLVSKMNSIIATISCYANGMATYCKNNNIKKCNGKFPTENTIDSIKIETVELIDAILNLDLYEIILEFFDVVHSIIKFFIINLVPERVYCNPIIWIYVFPFVFPVAIKLANRNKTNGCIRNHKNINNINHNCIHSLEKQ
jgi:hypothetical protein